MVTEWILKALAAVWEWFISHLPAIPVPDWFASASGSIAFVVDKMHGFDGWLPWTVLGIVITTILAALAISLAIKIARIVLSVFTAGGGSAG